MMWWCDDFAKSGQVVPMIGTNAYIIYMAKLVDFIGYYSQVVPNAGKKKSWEKTANHVKFEIIISQCI